jgi:hypothetical protein
MSQNLEEIEQIWIGLKFVGPVAWAILGGISSFGVWYLKKISSSLDHISTVIVRHEDRFEHHEVLLEGHEKRIDKVEDRVFK